MYNNVTKFLRQGKKHSLTFIVTFNALSIPGWLEYVKNILKLRQEFNTNRQLIWFDVPMLMDPLAEFKNITKRKFKSTRRKH